MPQRQLMFLVIAALMSVTARGQVKSEKEYRAGKDDIPPAAMEYVHSFSFPGKVKWYVEEGMTEKSLEAKTGHGQDRYSIEFHTDGRLQDVEIYRSWDQLDGALRSMIDEHLASRFNPYKIEKVQVQYSGEAAAVRDLILTGGSGDKVTTRYELVVDGVAEGRRDLWEFTFSADGSYEKSKKIILRSSENLEF